MPVYVFTCQDCGLRFEKLYRRVSEDQDHPCECGGTGKRQVTAAAFSFKHPVSQTPGALPPNTGTSDDFNFDKAIGRDAERKWKAIDQRNSVKDRTIRREREAGRAVSRDQLVPKSDGSGEYRVITESERVRANQNRSAAFEIAKAASKKTSGDKE